MREIKFRAWHKNNKSMCQNVKTDLLNRDYLEFMQYTGLKDKNGVEVYEGDIIENVDFKMNCKVGFKNGAFTKSWKNSNIHLLYDSRIADEVLLDWEVIGNIYENEDLLED